MGGGRKSRNACQLAVPLPSLLAPPARHAQTVSSAYTVSLLVSKLVSWCFVPSQPQRITSRLNTNFTLSRSYSFYESFYHKSFFFTYLHFAGTQQGNLHPTGWPILLCGPTQEPLLATANTGKNRERFWKKNVGEWTGREEISKDEIPGSKRNTHGYIRTFSGL